jgi:alkaline phosphatase
MIRFGLCTDSHYAERNPKKLRYYKHALDKMKVFIDHMNKEAVDFIVHLGDFKDQGVEENPVNTLTFLDSLESVFKQFNGPRYHCVGNHDVDSIYKQMFLDHIENTGIEKDKSYYSFDCKAFHFVVLDANFDEENQHHYMKGGSDWEKPFLSQRQLDWLERDLDFTELPTIIFCHHPIFEYYYEKYFMFVRNYAAAQSIFQDSGKVTCVFQGHVHEERYEVINGIHYFTSNAMVAYSYANNSYSIVEVEEGEIRINGFHRASTYIFSLAN